MEKRAYVIQKGKTKWLIGGYWSAGERFPKKPLNLPDVARKEGFDQIGLSAVWLKQEQQIGWFYFGDQKPGKGKPLAALALQRILNEEDYEFPLIGIFHIDDDIWWVIKTDNVGAMHPAWDVYGSKEEIENILSVRSSEVALAKKTVKIEDPEEFWSWALSNRKTASSIPYAVGVLDPQKALKKAIAFSVLTVVTALGTVNGYKWWKNYQQEKARQEMIAAQKQQEEQKKGLMYRQKLSEEQAKAEAIRLVNEALEKTRRPWERFVTWQELIKHCRIESLFQGGWKLESVECVPNHENGTITRNEVWVRQPWGTIKDAPSEGRFDSKGDKATVSKTLTVNTESDMQEKFVQYSSALLTYWLYQKQRLENVVDLEISNYAPFRPQIPNNVSEDVRKNINPPILWWEMPLSFSFKGGFDQRFSVFYSKGYIPTKIRVDLSKDEKWSFEGKHYAHP